jgi:uncharacterized protein YoxC
MVLINLAAVVVAVTLIVLAGFLIPAILELRKTAVALREFITRTDTEIQPVVRELHEALADLKVITGRVADNVGEVDIFMSAVGETGRGLRTISTVVGTVAGVMGKSSLWLAGAKVAGKFVLDKLTKQRG